MRDRLPGQVQRYSVNRQFMIVKGYAFAAHLSWSDLFDFRAAFSSSVAGNMLAHTCCGSLRHLKAIWVSTSCTVFWPTQADLSRSVLQALCVCVVCVCDDPWTDHPWFGGEG